MAKQVVDHEDHGHPSQSESNRYPADQRLRRAGFRIIARPKDGPAVWLAPDGRQLELDDALIALVDVEGNK